MSVCCLHYQWKQKRNPTMRSLSFFLFNGLGFLAGFMAAEWSLNFSSRFIQLWITQVNVQLFSNLLGDFLDINIFGCILRNQFACQMAAESGLNFQSSRAKFYKQNRRIRGVLVETFNFILSIDLLRLQNCQCVK